MAIRCWLCHDPAQLNRIDIEPKAALSGIRRGVFFWVEVRSNVYSWLSSESLSRNPLDTQKCPLSLASSRSVPVCTSSCHAAASPKMSSRSIGCVAATSTSQKSPRDGTTPRTRLTDRQVIVIKISSVRSRRGTEESYFCSVIRNRHSDRMPIPALYSASALYCTLVL